MNNYSICKSKFNNETRFKKKLSIWFGSLLKTSPVFWFDISNV